LQDYREDQQKYKLSLEGSLQAIHEKQEERGRELDRMEKEY
jgi:hypothetical protein